MKTLVTLARGSMSFTGRTLAGSGQSRGPGYFRSGWLPIRIRRRSPRGQRRHPSRISGWCLRPARPKPTSMSRRMRKLRASALWLNPDPPPLDHHPTPHLTPHCKPWPTLLTTGHRTSSMTFETQKAHSGKCLNLPGPLSLQVEILPAYGTKFVEPTTVSLVLTKDNGTSPGSLSIYLTTCAALCLFAPKAAEH